MAGVFPGCNNIDEFWSMLVEGRSGISTLSKEELQNHVPPELLTNPRYVRRVGRLTCGIDLFDHTFFDMTPREASFTDPQHRLLLEIVYRACEDAAVDIQSRDERIACFVAASESSYYSFNLKHLSDSSSSEPVLQQQIRYGNSLGTTATQVAYALNFSGAVLNVQTACSTGLVVLQAAIDHLRLGRCTTAVVGATCIHLPTSGYLYEPGSIYSSVGRCAPFDAAADGIVLSDAVCAVVLKLADQASNHRHQIRALIKSCTVNNNGNTSRTMSFAAPNAMAQAECISEALTEADIDVGDIAYIEAHGTGTILGDPIEVEGLTQAFHTTQREYCTLGSVKSNVGHTDTAAGLVGLIKTVLVLQHRYIPATLHFNTPNPYINFGSTPFIVRSTGASFEEERLERGPLYASVSSLGIGGTNAHAILQEYRENISLSVTHDSSVSAAHLVNLSGKDLRALEANRREFISWLQKQQDSDQPAEMSNICYTLNNGRAAYKYRLAVVTNSSSLSGLADTLSELSVDVSRPCQNVSRFVFMFPGQHKCSRSLTRQLYSTSQIFKDTYNKCAAILHDYEPNGVDMINILLADDDDASMNNAWETWMGVVTFIVEYGLMMLWFQMVQPSHVFIGHSLGEYVVATMTGVFKLDEAVKLIFVRTRLINRFSVLGGTGALLAVRLGYDDAVKFAIDDRLSIAAVNGPNQCVFAGDIEAIDELKSKLNEFKHGFKQLEHSFPFHSHMITPSLLNNFRLAYEQLGIKARAPIIPFVSTVTGDWWDVSQAIDAAYWCRHMRQTVLWHQAVLTLDRSYASQLNESDNATIYIECALRQVLTGVTKASVKADLSSVIPSVAVDDTDIELSLKKALSTCWRYGYNDIDHRSIYKVFAGSAEVYSNASFISISNYVFNKQRHWINPPSGYRATENVTDLTLLKTNEEIQETESRTDQPAMKTSDFVQKLIEIYAVVTGDSSINRHSDFFKCGGDSLTALILIKRINLIFEVEITSKYLMETPIIEQLAKRIELIKETEKVRSAPQNSVEQFSSLPDSIRNHDRIIVMKQGIYPSGPLIFAIAPTGGTCFIYRDLCEHLHASITVLALKYPEVLSSSSSDESSHSTNDESVSSLSSYYLEVIRSVQPDATSYILLGTSFGGMVGYEIAQQLSSLPSFNVNISRLFMIDTPTTDSMRIHLDDTSASGNKMANALVLCAMFGGKYNFSLDEAEQKCTEDEVQLKQFCIEKKILSDSSPNLDVEFKELRYYMEIFKRNMRAIDNYQPEPIQNQLTQITYVEVKSPLLHEPVEPHRTWFKLLPSEQFKLVYMDGHHLSINFEPHVQQVADLVNDTLLSLTMS